MGGPGGADGDSVMGTVIAGPGRREKSRPPRRRVVPLERWPEGRWRCLERLIGVRPADVRAFREATRPAVAFYVRWTRDDTPRPSGDEVRAEFEKLATAAGYLAERGLQLGFPDATRHALQRRGTTRRDAARTDGSAGWSSRTNLKNRLRYSPA